MLGSWIDRFRAPAYVGRVRPGSRVLVCAFLAGLAACAPSPPATPAPTPRLEGAVRAAREGTRLDGPRQIVFEWKLNDSGSRLHGRGVARTESPYRARLDLFTDNGETAARAALVENELRVPPEVDRRLVPPAPLLWASLGVFHPGRDARLLGGTMEGNDRARVRYRLGDGDDLVYDLDSGTLRSAELQRGGHTVERVRLTKGERTGLPKEATYRDLAAFRELKVTMESVERAEPFPSEIWSP